MTSVSPTRFVTIAGKAYRLDGSFSTLRAVQEHFAKDIVRILVDVMDMRFDEMAHLIAIGSGQPVDAIGQAIIDDVGQTIRYVGIKAQVQAWLAVALTPKPDREKKSIQMDEIVSKALSLGQSTSDSPSAPSAGSPANSGAVTSGS